MELFTATGKLKNFFFKLEMFDVCTTGDRHTSKIYSCQKNKNFFNFPVAVNNSIKAGPLVFLL